jgi:hypothetical protein
MVDRVKPEPRVELSKIKGYIGGRGFVSAMGATGLRTLDLFVPQKGCANLATWHRVTAK